MTPKLAYELFFRTNPDHITDAMFIKAHQIIEDLVAKAEPMKPNEIRGNILSVRIAVCPKCRYEIFDHENYCAECGQALDWSDEK